MLYSAKQTKLLTFLLSEKSSPQAFPWEYYMSGQWIILNWHRIQPLKMTLILNMYGRQTGLEAACFNKHGNYGFTVVWWAWPKFLRPLEAIWFLYLYPQSIRTKKAYMISRDTATKQWFRFEENQGEKLQAPQEQGREWKIQGVTKCICFFRDWCSKYL